MAEPAAHPASASSVAVIGLACRFPDADDPPTLLDTILTGRRAFRRLPPSRLDLAEYYNAGPAARDTTSSARAGLIEGWQFDRAAFRIPVPAYVAADPAHWLALETAARALAAAGFPGGAGLDRDRIGVIIGNTLAGDAPRATDRARKVLRLAAARYLAPLPWAGEHPLAGGKPASIPTGISTYFGFRGGSHAVDSASASSLQAVASACAALVAHDVDVALAGGVDVSLDPLELIALAKAEADADADARSDVRIYDENPTGYLPGEGCGVVVLMRTAQARAAGLPVYAEIIGWGSAAGGRPGVVTSDTSSQLLALRRAYDRAGVDPCEVQLIEGHGSGTRAGDEAELTALAELRADARDLAALGSIKANIGHARAAAGAAGLIKAVLALSTGVIPPTTGVVRPHPLLRGGDAALWLPEVPGEWPSGSRHAGVSAMGAGGVNVHLVLRSGPGRGSRYDRILRALPRLAGAVPGQQRAACTDRRPDEGRRPTAYLLHAPDRQQLAAALARTAEVAGWLSDAEMSDLACQLGRDARAQGAVRVAIVASLQDELARLARQAITLLPGLSDGLITTRPGIFAADNADGRVTLLLSGEAAGGGEGGADAGAGPGAEGGAGARAVMGARAGLGARAHARGVAAVPEALRQSLAMLRWLDSLDVSATAAVGHGLGEIAGLAWAGVLSEADAAEVAALRAEFLSGPAIRMLAPAGRHAGGRHSANAVATDALSLLRAALAQFRFGPPRRRLISTMTGRELASASEVADLLCGGLENGDRLAEAVTAGAQGATLLLETGPGAPLGSAAARVCRVPAVTAGVGDPDAGLAWAGAALFTAGAIGQAQALFAGQPARPVDIWRDRVFITSPCHAVPEQRPAPSRRHSADAGRVGPGHASTAEVGASTAGAGAASTADAGTPGTSTADVSHDSTVDAGHARTVEAGLASTASTGLARRGPAADEGSSRLPGAVEPTAAQGVGSPAGLASWVQCFTEEPGPPLAAVPPGDDRPWRIHLAGSYPFRNEVRPVFGTDQAAGRSLAVIGDPAAPGAMQAALLAARDAVGTGRLVAITTSPGLSGFLAVLHAENPELGLTELRVPHTADGLRLARRYASAEPGEFRELIVAGDGTAREPVVTAREVPGGDFPLGAPDVAVVSRRSGGAALALAQVLACSGSAVAVIGQTRPGEDSAVVGGLEELRLAGARVAYEVVNTADVADMAQAIQRVERRLGPVTAVAHAVGPGAPVPIAELTQEVLEAHLAAERAALRDLLRPVNPRRLQLILTFGSLAGRYGLVRQGLLAAASPALARQAETAAAGIPRCRALHIDLPGWSGGGLGQRPDLAESMAEGGMSAISVSEASRLMLKMLATPGLPSRTALHGRVGVRVPGSVTPARAGARDPRLAGRFLQDILVHHPGIELVCEAGLSLATDPYLGDYRVDGLPVLPPVLALEALAQAASALAGRPLRQVTAVQMGAPVVLSAGGGGRTRIRVCALAENGVIMAALRCVESGFGVDHLRAEFRLDSADAAGADDAVAGDAGAAGLTATAGAVRGAAAGLPGAVGGAGAVGRLAARPGMAGLVDGAELYGQVCFQSGRFRRIAALTEVTARFCRAVARGGEDRPWFAPALLDSASAAGLRSGDDGLLLGSPGLNDATLQALQACVPHRRVWPASCDSVTFSGSQSDGPVEIRASARVPAAPAEDAARARVPAPASSPEATPVSSPEATPVSPSPEPPEVTWDVAAFDSAGQTLVTWHGVRLREAGLLLADGAWPPSLLSVHLERGAIALGLDPGLRVKVRRAQLEPGQPTAQAPAARLPAPVPRSAVPRQARIPDDGAIAPGGGQLAGFTLELKGTRFAACGWAVVDLRHPAWPPSGGDLAGAFSQLCSHLPDPPVVSAARLEAVAACLDMAQVRNGAELTFERATADGWALLAVAGARVACIVVQVSGVPYPVAIAIMTDPPRRDRRYGRDHGGSQDHGVIQDHRVSRDHGVIQDHRVSRDDRVSSEPANG